MRQRRKILSSLESVYREAFSRAREEGDDDGMSRLDFEFQRDQIRLEVLLDIRDLLGRPPEPEGDENEPSILDRAEALKRITRLR